MDVLTHSALRSQLPSISHSAHKNQRGHLLIVAGSRRMRGACLLASHSAMRSGVGMLTVASVEEVFTPLMTMIPESMCLPLHCDVEGFLLNIENHVLLTRYLSQKTALLLGCGMGLTESTRELVHFLLCTTSIPIVLDADGLNALDGKPEILPEQRCILTPHVGECARLLQCTPSEIQADREKAVLALARKAKNIVILKGEHTLISDGERISLCPYGNEGLARAGSGDVLAGLCGSLLAQGMELYTCACLAVCVHALAADMAREHRTVRTLLPHDILSYYRELL